MSRLLEEHTAYELAEQWVAERYWPVGEQADNLRAELTGLLAASAMAGDGKLSRRIEKIWKILTGTYDPEKDKAKPVTKEQLKAAFGC